MKKIFTTRKRIVIAGVAASAVILGTGGAAWAYFATNGSGTGSATVGAAGTWKVDAGTVKGGPLYPDGTSTETIAFTVKNLGSGKQEFTSVMPSVAADGGGLITATGTAVPGCYATWFNAAIATPTDDPGINTEIASKGSVTVTVTVTMPADEVHNQTACAGASPDITLSVA